MAWVSSMATARRQFAAIRFVRWCLLINSLRSVHGSLEFVSRIVVGIFIALGGLGGAFGLGAGAYLFVSQGKAARIAVLLWPVFLLWQLFPVMTTAFSESLDASNLLRFPLRYRSYFLVRLVYGALDAGTALGSLWLLGIMIGIGLAAQSLLPWAGMVLISFAMVNILLARLIFVWVERWLAQRRTREIMGVMLILVSLSFQLLGPLMGRYGRRSGPGAARIAQELSPEQRLLPPGLSAQAISAMREGHYGEAWGAWALLISYGVVFLWLLDLRLRAQYRGENLSESTARRGQRATGSRVRPAWNVFGLPGPIAAVFEKELRYLARSGPMLFTLIMPAFMLLVFRLGPSGRNDGLLTRAPNFAFPIGAAYALLILTNLVYNNFGSDATGVQLFFAAPARFREIVLGKNLAHTAILLMEMLTVGGAVCLIFRPPAIDVTLATLTGMLFAAPVNFTVGNLLSIYWPKKIDFGLLGRQRASQVTVLASFGVQLGVLGLGAVILLFSRRYGSLWMATAVFPILAVLAFAAYKLVLDRIDEVALTRRENIISELSRP